MIEETPASDDDGHWEGRVLGIDATGLQVDQLFDIAMVGGNDHRPAFCLHDAVVDPLEPAIDKLARLDRRLEIARVGDHVGIGIVDHNEIVQVALDGTQQLDGLLFSRHLGSEIVGRHLGGRGDSHVLPWEWKLALAIEVIGDEALFFTFGQLELAAAREREDAGKRHFHELGGEGDLDRGIFLVFGHGDHVQIRDDPGAGEAVGHGCGRFQV